MDLQLAGRNAVVLGGSRGLGRAIASALAAENANVLICSRSADALEQTASELEKLGSGSINWHVADLADPDAPASIHAAAIEALGGVDILVNNGGGPPPGLITAVDRQTWEAQYQSMVTPLFELSGLCLPMMRENHGAGYSRSSPPACSNPSPTWASPIPCAAASLAGARHSPTRWRAKGSP